MTDSKPTKGATMPAGRPKTDKTIIKNLQAEVDYLLKQNAELQQSLANAITDTHKAQRETAELRSKFCDFYFLLGEIDNEYPKMDEGIMLAIIRMLRDVADLESSK